MRILSLGDQAQTAFSMFTVAWLKHAKGDPNVTSAQIRRIKPLLALPVPKELPPGLWAHRVGLELQTVGGVTAWNTMVGWVRTQLPQQPSFNSELVWKCFPRLLLVSRIVMDLELVLGAVHGMLLHGHRLNAICAAKAQDMRYDPKYGCPMIFWHGIEPDGRGGTRRYTQRAMTLEEQVYAAALKAGVYGEGTPGPDALLLPGAQPRWWNLLNQYATDLGTFHAPLARFIAELKSKARNGSGPEPEPGVSPMPPPAPKPARPVYSVSALPKMSKPELDSEVLSALKALVEALPNPTEAELAAGAEDVALAGVEARRLAASKGSSGSDPVISAPPASGMLEL